MWIAIIVATVFIQIPNIWAISLFSKEPTFLNALKIGLLTLPFTFIASSCYAYFTELEGKKLAIL